MTIPCKAWRTEALGIVLLVYAPTREEAITTAVRCATMDGHDVHRLDVSVERAPHLDGPQAEFQRGKCLEWREP